MTTTPPTLQIAVLDRGYVYVGICAIADGMLTIRNAQNICRWGTTAGLGQLATSGPTAKSKIDPAGTIHAPLNAVIHLIDCAPAAWHYATVAA